MKKNYKLIRSEVVADNDKATVVKVVIKDKELDDEYEGRGIAKTLDGEIHDSRFGKDLAEARAIKNALSKMYTTYRESVMTVSRALFDLSENCDCLYDNMSRMDDRISYLIDSLEK